MYTCDCLSVRDRIRLSAGDVDGQLSSRRLDCC